MAHTLKPFLCAKPIVIQRHEAQCKIILCFQMMNTVSIVTLLGLYNIIG